jgi:hypothetical protein
MGYAMHVGRVGALAVALGIGTAVISTPGIAWADEPGASSNDNAPSQNTADTGGVGATSDVGGQTPASSSDSTAKHDTEEHETTTTTSTATQGSTTTVVGAGSTPSVTFSSSGNTGSLGADTHKDAQQSGTPSTAASVQPVVETPSPSTLESTPSASTPPPVAAVVIATATPTAAVEETLASIAATTPKAPGTPPPTANPLALQVIPSTNASEEVPTGQITGRLAATRLFAAPNVEDDPATVNTLQANTFSALVAPALPGPTVPPPTLVDTLLALPGTFISTALNLITQALSPLIGPGAPADNPVLWGLLAFVRRQFSQSVANSTPVLDPRQTSQDVDDGQVHGTFGGTDADGDTLTYTVPTTGVGAPAHGTVTIDQSAGTWTYTPEARFAGEDSFYVTASDEASGLHVHALGQTHASIATVAVTVTGAPPVGTNKAPVATNDAFGTPEDTALTTGNVLTNDTDPDDDALTAAIVTGPSHAASFALNPNGSFSYTAAANYNGPDSFSYKASDGTLSSNTATVAITVTAVNDAPVAGSPSISTAEDTAYTGTLSATDVDSTTLTFTGPATSAAGGTVAVNSAGSFSYTPVANYNGPDSFSYNVTDGTATAAGTVAIAVTAVNGAPVAGSPSISTAEDTAYTGTLSATDVDSTTLTFTGPTTSTAGGTVAGNPDGSFSYTPKADYSGADSFSYTVSDGTATATSTATGTVAITVTPAPAVTLVNPSPISGTALGNAVVGSTGLIYQLIAQGTSSSDITTYVRVYQPNGALIGDSAPFTGIPLSAPVVRTDGSVAVATFDSGAHTAVVTIVSGAQNHITTSPTTFQADGVAQTGQGDRQYLLTTTRDAQNQIHVKIVPLSVGALTAYDTSTVPVYGPDGSAAALQITGSTPQTASAKLLMINADGTSHTVAAPELLTSGLAGGLSIGPDGTVYLPTVVGDQSGGTTTEVLIFNSSGGYTKSQIPGVAPVSNVTVAANGTAYLLTNTPPGTGDDNYKIAVLTGPGAIISPTISTAFFQPTIIGTSNNGTLYVLDSDSDDDVSRVIVARPNGSVVTVGLGDFSFDVDHVIGADNNLYVNYRENNNYVSAVITSSGQKRVLPFGIDIDPFTGKANNLAFGDDGTAYVAVPAQGGVTVRVSRDGFATFHESAPIAGTATGLAVGPDGTAVLLTSGSGVVATAIDPGGHILATITGNGEAAGPVAFNEGNGSAYVAVVETNPSTGNASTSVWGITLAGATKDKTVPGTPAGGQAGGTATLSMSQQGDVFLTTSSTDENGAPITNVSVAPGVSLPPSPYHVVKNLIDPSNGVTTVNITSDGTASYSGSTTSPIGDVQVNSDGTVVFTPSAAGRQLAAQNNRTLYASFVVTATDSAGHDTYIPMTVLLRPDDYPTQDKPLPHTLQDLEDVDGGVEEFDSHALRYGFTPVQETNVHDLQEDDPIVNGQQVTGLITYTATWTRTKSLDAEDWPTDPLSGLPVDPDIYVVSLYRPAGAAFDIQVLVLGYRKMNLGDSIVVKTDWNGTPGIARPDYAVVAFRPGTFPKDWFQSRPDPDGEVGGNIFNNEIPDDTWEPWQDQEDDFENIRNYDEEMRLRAPYIGQGANMTLNYLQWAQGARGEAGEIIQTEETARRIVKGVKLANGTVQLVSGENEIANQNGGTSTPVFVVEGQVRSTAPHIGIPD